MCRTRTAPFVQHIASRAKPAGACAATRMHLAECGTATVPRWARHVHRRDIPDHQLGNGDGTPDPP